MDYALVKLQVDFEEYKRQSDAEKKRLEEENEEYSVKLREILLELANNCDAGTVDTVAKSGTGKTKDSETYGSTTLQLLEKALFDSRIQHDAKLKVLETENVKLQQEKENALIKVKEVVEASYNSNTETVGDQSTTNERSFDPEYTRTNDLNHLRGMLSSLASALEGIEEAVKDRSDMNDLEKKLDSVLAQDRKETIKFLFRLDTKLDDQTGQIKIQTKHDLDAHKDLVDLVTAQHGESIRLTQRVLTTVQRKNQKSQIWIVVGWVGRILFYTGLLSIFVYFGLIWDNSVNAFICAPALSGTRITPESGLLIAPFWIPNNSTLKNAVYRVLCTNVPRVKLKIHNQQLIVRWKNPYREKKRAKSEVRTYPATVAYVAEDMLYMADIDGWHTEIPIPWKTKKQETQSN
mmetsp:Transcript_8398/g.11031  ORF Transcript_8398/g.11031 Transcript_8398/m.11031 type:complete len:406 (+) Transcript_8398:112-1329(+)